MEEGNYATDGMGFQGRTGGALVGLGARALFYPTLFYNVVRNKIQAEFRWWDEVDEFLLLGAVPFPKDVPRLKELGVGGVITLNEPYETLVPTSLYKDHGIKHLEIPTRDYLFAPSYANICRAVDFIHNYASCGMTTYVHCKAGRGRSTTVVLCYLAVQEFGMRRSRPLLVMPTQLSYGNDDDENSLVLVTLEDIEGYSPSSSSSKSWEALRTACKVQVAAARGVMRMVRASAELARFSCILFAETKLLTGKLRMNCAPVEASKCLLPSSGQLPETGLEIVVC
ncbi:phosphatidylglycerophosphate phosphatase PTPMT2-like isoform X2 [Nymphaea colorata]|uniref:phosphatidylglycerophosphate phosphatase PTPMT2-like isoform X2 n=1 Tax=Nymphaea colorata TaxID=210225 RepID=UPI00129E367D|nr:phosphatidylglycerophosphate phosphatase PTPMT2-like isoform X2 [Nymphaea colorata]